MTPRDGRPIPVDARPNDLADSRAMFLTRDAERAAAVLRMGPCAVASAAVVPVKDRSWGFARRFLARDPDGHGFEVIER